MIKFRFLFATLLFAMFLLFINGTATAGGFYITGSGSAYQTPDSVGPGWLLEVGVGYRIIKYVATQVEVGWGHYIVELSSDDRRAVNFIPITPAVVVDILPDKIIDPFVTTGVVWTWRHMADRGWDNDLGFKVGGGLRMYFIPNFGITVQGGYYFPKIDDLSAGAWTYGLNFGFNF